MNHLALRIALALAAAVAAGVILSAVAIFLGGIAHLSLVEVMSPIAAAAIVSLSGLAVAGALVFGGIHLLRHASPRRAPFQPPEESHLAKQLESLVGSEFVSLIAGHPRASAVSALLAGLVVGARPDLRKSLRDLL